MTAARPLPQVAERKRAVPQETGRAPLPRQEHAKAAIREIGGPEGPEPTRYGDWERNGRCSDF